MQPTVGSSVHLGAQPVAALVTEVNADGTVGLTVFPPGQPPMTAASVPYSETPADGAWSWPPHV